MTYVHKSVNDLSVAYLQNERRHNYTTPKSFLEQINLYENLLRKNNKDLQTKIIRLENGLEKLRSTASQVKKLMNTTKFNLIIHSEIKNMNLNTGYLNQNSDMMRFQYPILTLRSVLFIS